MISEINEYLSFLSTDETFDEDLDFSVFKTNPFIHTADVVRCTTSAMLIADKFNGSVFGYEIENPSDTLVAGWCLGHDFAVVGRYLIDWWAHNVESHPKMIIDILSDKDYLAEKYLPQHMWQKLKIWDKK